MSFPIITQAEAARLSIACLREFHIELLAALADSEQSSPEAIQIAASLRIVMRELNRRYRLSRTPALGRPV